MWDEEEAEERETRPGRHSPEVQAGENHVGWRQVAPTAAYLIPDGANRDEAMADGAVHTLGTT